MNAKVLVFIIATILFGGLLITAAFGIVGFTLSVLFSIGMFLVKELLPIALIIGIGVYVYSKLK